MMEYLLKRYFFLCVTVDVFHLLLRQHGRAEPRWPRSYRLHIHLQTRQKTGNMEVSSLHDVTRRVSYTSADIIKSVYDTSRPKFLELFVNIKCLSLSSCQAKYVGNNNFQISYQVGAKTKTFSKENNRQQTSYTNLNNF